MARQYHYDHPEKYLARQRLARTLGIIAVAVAAVVAAGLVYVAIAGM